MIGLHGPWGDGKTSVLKFVEHTLKSDPSTTTKWFNPWRFVHEEAMLSEFFTVLAASVHTDLKTKGEKLASIVVNYGKWVAPFDDRAAHAVEAASRKSAATVDELRERLRKGLLTLGKRIVVFIDDIDRLESSEVAALFRLIKACADLPNVVYVLAFDRELVARALGARLVDGDEESGRKFLEKIIQVPVVLPVASRRDLDRVCMESLDIVLQSVGLTLSDPEKLRWQWAYRDGISRRIKTPRHVTQYLNAVRFALPLLANEVNTVDLLLVEALRICYTTAYETIRMNQGAFIGAPIGEIERQNPGSPQDDLLAAAKDGLDNGDADALDRLVETMFPRYHFAQRGFVLGYESVNRWTRDRLVCSPAYGPRYFSYAIGSSDVADSEIAAILRTAASDKSTQLRTLLHKQLEALKQRMLIFKLNDQLTLIPGKAAARIATTLATLSDCFDEPFSLEDSNHAGIQGAVLVATLCRQSESEAERLAVSTDVLNHCQEMWFACAFMREIDPPHAHPETSHQFVAGESMKRLREAFLARYGRHIKTSHSQLDLERRWKFEALYSVVKAGGRQLIHDRYVPRMQTDGNIAIRFLQLLAQPVASAHEIIPTPEVFGPEDLESLSLLVNVDEMARIVIDNWVREDRQKGPKEWLHMKPDDRVLAQFWYHYTLRAKTQAADKPATSAQYAPPNDAATESTR